MDTEDFQNTLRYELVLSDYWRLVALVLMVYDYLLTLDTEVKCLWQRRATRSSYIFFILRYFNLGATILSFLSTFITGWLLSCHSLLVLREVIVILTQFTVGSILTLRIYALYDGNRRLLWFLLSVVVIMVGLTCYLVFSSHEVQPTPKETLPDVINDLCRTELDRDTSIRQGATWIMVSIYDTIIFGLAVWNAFQTRKELNILRRSTVSLKIILLRDGAMYFGIMSVVNMANILTYYLAQGGMRGGLAPFASSLEATLVSRLMLNLHRVIDKGIYASSCALNANTHSRSEYGGDTWSRTSRTQT